MKKALSAVLAVSLLISGGSLQAATLTQLTLSLDIDEDPCFSPGGDEIAFIKNNELWLMPSSGEPATRQLTSLNLNLVWPVWSPDGQTIVFGAQDGDVWELWEVDVIDGGPMKITSLGGEKRHPSWSPSGSEIAFAWNGGGGFDFDIWIMPAAGGTPIEVIGDPSYHEVDPTWSPDGNQIGFASNATGDYEIYSQSISGGLAVQLTSLGGTNIEPVWSPDGDWIAFTHIADVSYGIWVVPATGGAALCVTCPGFGDGTPGWSPDSESLVFDRQSGAHVWLASDLPLGPTAVQQTSWGRLKALFR